MHDAGASGKNAWCDLDWWVALLKESTIVTFLHAPPRVPTFNTRQADRFSFAAPRCSAVTPQRPQAAGPPAALPPSPMHPHPQPHPCTLTPTPTHASQCPYAPSHARRLLDPLTERPLSP